MSSEFEVCCLCGKPATAEDELTREHVPPKQFYPKAIRGGLNLWVVPTHRSCNNNYKADEEYFYHAVYPLVANANPATAAIILDDLKRRAKEPQTRVLLRRILRTTQTMTPGGIALPPGIILMRAHKYRLQRAAIKIGRCLFFRDHKRFMPYENCKDIRLCERDEDVPEVYQLSWEMSKVNLNELSPTESRGSIFIADQNAGKAMAASRQIFSYRTASFDNLHLYTLMFWEAFVFCMTFEEPVKAGK